MNISYYEYDNDGVLVPVYEKDAVKFGRWVFKDDKMIRIGGNSGQAPLTYGSDNLGVQGVRNQIDGQMYDSKSQLRRAYKSQGVQEVGNDTSTKPRKQLGNYDCRADVALAMKQLGVME